jgi:hypothetical protein
MPSSIVMVRLDKSDSRCNVRLKSIVVEVYSLLTANDGKLAFQRVASCRTSDCNVWSPCADRDLHRRIRSRPDVLLFRSHRASSYATLLPSKRALPEHATGYIVQGGGHNCSDESPLNLLSCRNGQWNTGSPTATSLQFVCPVCGRSPKSDEE